MSIKLSSKAALALAALLAGAAAFLVWSLQERHLQKVSAVVAVKPVQAWSLFHSDMVAVERRPRASLPPDAVTDIQELRGRHTLVNLSPGDIVRRSWTVEGGDSPNRLSLALDRPVPDQVAIGIPYEPGAGAGGEIRPGDLVDVIATFSEPPCPSRPGQGQETVQRTRVLAPMARVLAVHADTGGAPSAIQERGQEAPAAPRGEVVAAVPREAAVRIAHALSAGKVRLVLRSLDAHAADAAAYPPERCN